MAGPDDVAAVTGQDGTPSLFIWVACAPDAQGSPRRAKVAAEDHAVRFAVVQR